MILFYILILIFFESLEYSGICVGKNPTNTVINLSSSLTSCFPYLPANENFNLPYDYCSQNFSILNFSYNGNSTSTCFFPYYGYYSPNIVKFLLNIIF